MHIYWLIYHRLSPGGASVNCIQYTILHMFKTIMRDEFGVQTADF